MERQKLSIQKEQNQINKLQLTDGGKKKSDLVYKLAQSVEQIPGYSRDNVTVPSGAKVYNGKYIY